MMIADEANDANTLLLNIEILSGATPEETSTFVLKKLA
jgi:hypothetical protein